MFPIPASLLVPQGLSSAEIHDEWQVSDRRILSEAPMAKLLDLAAGAQQASTGPAVAIPVAIAS